MKLRRTRHLRHSLLLKTCVLTVPPENPLHPQHRIVRRVSMERDIALNPVPDRLIDIIYPKAKSVVGRMTTPAVTDKKQDGSRFTMKIVAETAFHMPISIAKTLMGQGMIIAIPTTEIEIVTDIDGVAPEVVPHIVTKRLSVQRKVVV